MEDDKQGRVLMTKATKQICHSLSFSSASIHPSPPHPMPIFLHACCNGVCCLYQLESSTGGSVCDLRRVTGDAGRWMRIGRRRKRFQSLRYERDINSCIRTYRFSNHDSNRRMDGMVLADFVSYHSTICSDSLAI